MAKSSLKKVAQRLVSSHCHRHHLKQRSQLSTNSNALIASEQHGKISGSALWSRPQETSYFTQPLEAAIENMKDDEDIRKDLLSNENDILSVRPTPKLDTHAMVKGLMAGGFTLNQAEVLTTTIVDMATDNTDSLQDAMVSKAQAKLTLQKIASQLAILRRDMMIMEKTDFTELVTKIERITHELQQLQTATKDEITKISSDLILDFNLEKGHVKDMHLEHLKVVEGKHGRIYDRLIALEKELQNIRSYINTENAAIQTIFERYKSDTIKLAFGAVATCMTIVLGFYRLWS